MAAGEDAIPMYTWPTGQLLPRLVQCRHPDLPSLGAELMKDLLNGLLTTAADRAAYRERLVASGSLICEEEDSCSVASADTGADCDVQGDLDVTVVDCRYRFEHEGGHIKGSTSQPCSVHFLQGAFPLPPTDLDASDSPDSSDPRPHPRRLQSLHQLASPARHSHQPLHAPTSSDSTQVFVFHCEFSANRGPDMARRLRNTDRHLHMEHFPFLAHPHLYVLEGGYKAFHALAPGLCSTGAYVPMLHPTFLPKLPSAHAASKDAARAISAWLALQPLQRHEPAFRLRYLVQQFCAMQGHLKEQDEFFQYILAQLAAQGTMSPEKYDAVFSEIEGMIQEHIDEPEGSKLSEAVPTLKAVHTPLPLTEALAEYDDHTRVRQRKFVPMTFKEVRHVVNIATVKVVAPQLRLLCLDADETCYSDGGTITPDSPMIPIITSFIRAGITVCLVTAAGYANAPGKYEHRLRGLLDAFQFAVNMGAPSDAFQRHFYVMGGEANYLHRLVVSRKGRLQLAVVPGEEWKNGRGVRWSLEGIRSLLDIAEDTLRERAAALGLAVQFIRKERAVGMIRAGDAKFPFEVLEEVALAVQAALKGHPVPHCAFNGGQDCWVDVGNKALGIRAVQAFLSPKANASNTVHVVVRTHPKVAAVTAEAVAPIAPIKPPGTAAAAMSAGVSGWVSQGDDTPVTSGAADLPQHAAAALGVSTRPRTPEQGDAAEAVRRPYTPDVLPAQEGDHVSPLVQAVAAPPPGTMAPLALPVAAPSASRVRSALDADGGVVVGAEAGRAPPVGATRRLSLAGSGEGSDSDDDAEGGTSAVDLDMSWLE